MKVEHVLLRSKVARRIFSLFVLCALLPLSILAFFSYRYVTRELQGQADQRLHEAAKSAGMTIVERMQFLDTQLEMAAAHIPKAGREGHGSLAEELCQRLRGFFKGLALRWEDGESLLLIGEIGKAPILEKDEAQHIASGKTLVFTRDTGEGHTKTFMARLMTGNETVHGLLFGEINPEYLWGGDGFLLSMTELLVIDRSRNVLFSSFPHYDPSKELDEALKQSGVSRRFTWTYDGDRYIASLWTIFMAPQFHDNWTVVQSRLHTEIMAPLHNFKQIFIFSVILTFAVVLLLSHIQVRRNLTPLEFLMNATRRIAAKDFGHQVKIETNDEFEELGASFNEMAARLEIHLEIVTTLNRIGIALTAERDTERLTELILLGAKRITNADGCSLYTISDDKRLQLSLMKIDSLSLVRQGSDGIWIPLYDEGRPNERNVAAYCALNDTTINIPGNHTAEGFDLAGSLPIDLEEDYRVKSFLSIPMKNHEQEVIGVLQLINARDTRTLKTVPFSEEDKHLAEILAAQAGVALMKNKLLDDYKRLFESVTELLATAIDEMSPHTGGHCRRVPDITMMLAEAVCNKREGAFKDVMMTEEELYELKVAALLHDCGKVTTPVHIVDKTTKLQTIFDRMHIIEARFEILRRDAEIAMLQRELALRGGNGEEVISALRAETESLLEELAGDRDFLRSCNIGGESMEQAHLDRLKAVAQKYRVLNTRGEMETILSEEELGMLSIRYGNLTSEERRVINQHVETGERLLRTIQFPRYLENVPVFAAVHHERLNGKGYPRGLAAQEIPLQGRIIALADIFEALTATDRPYRERKTLMEALCILASMKENGQIDPDLFDVFVSDNIYLRYARKYMCPEQIDEVDLSKITEYSPSLPK